MSVLPNGNEKNKLCAPILIRIQEQIIANRRAALIALATWDKLVQATVPSAQHTIGFMESAIPVVIPVVVGSRRRARVDHGAAVEQTAPHQHSFNSFQAVPVPHAVVVAAKAGATRAANAAEAVVHAEALHERRVDVVGQLVRKGVTLDDALRATVNTLDRDDISMVQQAEAWIYKCLQGDGNTQGAHHRGVRTDLLSIEKYGALWGMKVPLGIVVHEGNHWLLAIIDIQGGILYLRDSLKKYSTRFHAQVFEDIETLLAHDWAIFPAARQYGAVLPKLRRVVVDSVPQQSARANSCGVHVMHGVVNFGTRLQDHYTEKDMTILRRSMSARFIAAKEAKCKVVGKCQVNMRKQARYGEMIDDELLQFAIDEHSVSGAVQNMNVAPVTFFVSYRQNLRGIEALEVATGNVCGGPGWTTVQRHGNSNSRPNAMKHSGNAKRGVQGTWVSRSGTSTVEHQSGRVTCPPTPMKHNGKAKSPSTAHKPSVKAKRPRTATKQSDANVWHSSIKDGGSATRTTLGKRFQNEKCGEAAAPVHVDRPMAYEFVNNVAPSPVAAVKSDLPTVATEMETESPTGVRDTEKDNEDDTGSDARPEVGLVGSFHAGICAGRITPMRFDTLPASGVENQWIIIPLRARKPTQGNKARTSFGAGRELKDAHLWKIPTELGESTGFPDSIRPRCSAHRHREHYQWCASTEKHIERRPCARRHFLSARPPRKFAAESPEYSVFKAEVYRILGPHTRLVSTCGGECSGQDLYVQPRAPCTVPP